MSFQQRITAALNNPNLQIALDKSAARRMAGRAAAFESLPQAEAVRDRARAIRLDVLAHLETYLEQFTARLEERGTAVHWAGDAAEACQIIIGLSQAREVQTVAKSKSMVSEEIELNRALLAAGIVPVETDLGEYIVQLRGETPSHIIAPAIHLRREEVAQTFQQHLKMEPTTDVETMTAAARQALRQTFLTAGMGLSGVNFGVAETGSLCLVTNEGNGRMVTSLPPVHVALMGLERLVPTMEDLDIMLKVLPRSATGQKLTVYTALLTGPRRPAEPDGPDELHVVMLDNGRARILASELAESLLCIRCGACLNVCPVYREIGGHAYGSVYPGPIGSVLAPAFGGASDFGHLAHASTLCGACLEVCPVRIDIPRMLLAVRGLHVEQAPQPAWLRWGIKFYSWIAAEAGRYRLAQSLAGFGSHILFRDGWVRRLPGPLSRWTMNRDFPAFARETFRSRLARRRGHKEHMSSVKYHVIRDTWHVKRHPSLVTRHPSPVTLPAREAIFTRIRAASHGVQELMSLPQGGARLESDDSRHRAKSGRIRVGLHFQTMADRFGEELTALGGTFAIVNSERLPQAVLDILAGRNARRLLTWLPEALPWPGLYDRLKREGFALFGPMVPAAGPERESNLAERATAEAGLTGCEAALAETGSLVVRSGPGQGRLASLIAPVHIALVRPEQFFPSFEAFLEHHRRAGSFEALFKDSSSLTLITGPSRTADIEMTLTIGVHGPAEVHVLCIA